mgnify:CR=1 FL=1
MGKRMDYVRKQLKKPLIIVAFGVILFVVCNNLNFFWTRIGSVLSLLSPLLYGFCIAYILNIPMRAIERLLFRNPKRKLYRFRRLFSISLTFVLALAVLVTLSAVIVPQLASSVATLVERFPSYVSSVQRFINQTTETLGIADTFWVEFENWMRQLLGMANKILENVLPNVLGGVVGVTSGVFNAFLGLVLCIYLLYNKEKLCTQLKNCLHAFVRDDIADILLRTGRFTNTTFSRFFAGQLTEAVILGVLCFAGMSIFRMPYALLISVIVAATSVIPIFGAYIGTIPSAFIIFMVKPITALWFVLFIIVLQQLEGNLIYPKVVGSSIGLSGLWVLLAIMVGGGMFGILGIFIGIPAMAVLYRIAGDYVEMRLERKKAAQAAEAAPPEPAGE